MVGYKARAMTSLIIIAAILKLKIHVSEEHLWSPKYSKTYVSQKDIKLSLASLIGEFEFDIFKRRVRLYIYLVVSSNILICNHV